MGTGTVRSPRTARCRSTPLCALADKARTWRERRRAPNLPGETGRARRTFPVGAFELAARQLDQWVGKRKAGHRERSATAGALRDADLADALPGGETERCRGRVGVEQHIEGVCGRGQRGFVLRPIHWRRPVKMGI